MGLYDREYYRRPAPRAGLGNISLVSVTTWLIVINVAVFLLDRFLASTLFYYEVFNYRLGFRMQFGPLEYWGYFSIDQAIFHFQFWRIITCQFLHASVGHLFGNMLALFLFGQIVQSYWGGRRFIVFYLLCGCAGVACYTLMAFAGILQTTPYTPLVGASAGIFGVLVAAAMIAPNVTVMLLFPPIPIQLKYLAIVMIAVAAYTALFNGLNAGGEAAHLGGGALGYLLMRHPRVVNAISGQRSYRGPPRYFS
jgi:membrane associated rhomboid family serine protease